MSRRTDRAEMGLASDRSVSAGHLRVVDQPTFSALPHEILFDPELSRDAIVLYAVLQSYWWQSGECWASHATLAAKVRVKDRMLRYYLRELIERGWITERLRGQGQAKAYAPTQAATDCQLNRQGNAALSGKRLPAKRQEIASSSGKRLPAEEDSMKKTLRRKKNPPSGGVAADAAPTPARTKRRVKPKQAVPEETPAPETIELTDVSYATAAKMGFSREAVDFELERFLAWATSKGKTYSVWKQAFRTWLMNEFKYAKQREADAARKRLPTGTEAPRRGSIASITPSERFQS